MASYQLKANKWKKVGQWYGTSSKKISISVGTSKKCSWRKKAAYVTTSSGTFKQKKVLYLFNQWVDVKSPVNTTCTTTFATP